MANVTHCITEGKRLFTSCNVATTFQECCTLAVAERADEQCLFAGVLGSQQIHWASDCCGGGLSDARCHGYDCRWFTPSLCCPGAEGMIFPLFGEAEAIWPQGVKIVLYITGLIYLFMAVTVAADIFMQGVEVITSTQIKITMMVDGKKKIISVHRWNDTVANLTLMALGSSAPEILLSIIELLANNFYAGTLGPATIVGSASFNLFIISAICISALPADEVRHIRDVNVFFVTATFSIFAYLWIVFILEATTPDRVEIWEAFTTFSFSGFLIIIAYLADIGKIQFFRTAKKYIAPELGHKENAAQRQSMLVEKTKDLQVQTRALTEKEMAFFKSATRKVDVDVNLVNDPICISAFGSIIQQYRAVYGNITDTELAQLLTAWMEEGPPLKNSRAVYRSQATSMLTGGGDYGKKQSNPHCRSPATRGSKDVPERICSVSFEFPFYSCIEGDKIAFLDVVRTGPDCAIEVPYKTIDSTALDGTDYVAVDSVLTMERSETKKRISIEIIDDDICDDDKHLFVRLGTPRASDSTVSSVGPYAEARVTIIDDDEPGVILFDSQEKCLKGMTHAKVRIKRESGCSAAVSCDYHTFPQTATPDKDYITTQGELKFARGDVEKTISIPLVDGHDRRKQLTFRVALSNPRGGVTFLSDDAERTTRDIQTVVILESQDVTDSRSTNGVTAEDTFVDAPMSVSAAFAEQFREAIYTNGSYEDSKTASIPERLLHYCSLPFKVLLALIPPSRYGGGWLRFGFSMLFIAIFTAFINEMAQLVGCALGVPDSITAITFVALDNCIGNITGSNSVNVFLGLGISWSIGAIFWELNTDPIILEEWLSRYSGKVNDDVIASGGFAVRAGTLSLNVLAFSVGALVTLAHLLWRRIKFGGELGGPKKSQHISSAFLVVVWFGYIISAAIAAIHDNNKLKAS